MGKRDFSTANFALAENVQLEMVEIPGLQFKVELENVSEEKMAEIRQDFMLGKYPVTQEQFEAVMGFNPSGFKGAKRPVENVTWDEAKEFCEKLNERISLTHGRKFSLPTQFQWDYVAMSKGTVPFEDEEKFGEFAWFGKNAEGKTHEVGLKKPNPFGLYDLYGNVHEWCDAEWENAGKPGCPTPPKGNAMRVAPGGAWEDDAETCVKGVFLSGVPETRKSIIGFRVAIVPGEYTAEDGKLASNHEKTINRQMETSSNRGNTMKQFKTVVFTRFRNPTEGVKKALRKLSELAAAQPCEDRTAEIATATAVAGIQVHLVSAESAGHARILALQKYPESYVWCSENPSPDISIWSLVASELPIASNPDR